MITTKLELQLNQQLKLSPKLQQSIQLLQMTTLELQQKIQLALESNPFLEFNDDIELSNPTNDTHDPNLDPRENSHDDPSNDIEWAPQTYSSFNQSSSNYDPYYFLNNQSQTISLHQYLKDQINLEHLSQKEQVIADCLIDSIDSNGYLCADLKELHEQFKFSEEVSLDEMESVLGILQQLEPAGIAARNLKECLMIQLENLNDHSYQTIALDIVSHHLEWLADYNEKNLIQRYQLTQSEYQHIKKLIHSLNPYPGQKITDNENPFVIPEIIVYKKQDYWNVQLNPDAFPTLRINPVYVALLNQQQYQKDQPYFKHQLQQAQWFLKCLENRHDTLLKTATSIVKHQQRFLIHGEQAMNPLTLREIADDLNMHESTISRITTGKYILTPQGILELKYFFSSHLTNPRGQSHSATAIKALIRKIISNESADNPCSDHKITQLINHQGIPVARRTITKYRELMKIPNSNERKQTF